MLEDQYLSILVVIVKPYGSKPPADCQDEKMYVVCVIITKLVTDNYYL